jgi:hypothetical protein
MVHYGLTIFLSAFLLFQIQPMIGKYLLPRFGGSPAVWTTCLLFFQVLLLAGYSYAYWLTSRLRPRAQAALHSLLLAGSLLLLPINPSAAWKTIGDQSPTWSILALLSWSAGIPCFLLSSTGPLLQDWFSRSAPSASPYPLYALSNLGSLLALATYPFLIEPMLPLGFQMRFWSWTWTIFAISCAFCCVELFRSRGPGRAELVSVGVPPRFSERALWFGLAACGVLILMATNNQMCQDVAVVPFLWMLPLGLYLLSLIILFHKPAWYFRRSLAVAFIPAMVQVCYVLYRGVFISISWQIVSYSVALFVCCMICHGELVRLKPEPRFLTDFYLTVAAGGAVAGIFVAVAAPFLFKGYWEFHCGLAATSLLILITRLRDGFHDGRRWLLPGFWLVSFCALGATLAIHVLQSREDEIKSSRNFHGILRILDEDRSDRRQHRYTLKNGRIEHGFQFQEEDKRHWPTSYYGADSGLGMAITFHPRRLEKRQDSRNLRIGVVGLGTGTIAAYGEAEDYFRFYEINPDVVHLAAGYFTYLKDSPARIEIIKGDARLSMERELASGQAQQFDVLAIDAFSSDAIPVHLLTSECFGIYWYHLKPDGILAVHVSSRYFELTPVVRASALLTGGPGAKVLRILAENNDIQGTDASEWLLVSKNDQFLNSGPVQLAVKPWPENAPPFLHWTDDYSNLFRALN